jgi:hypothetical protein
MFRFYRVVTVTLALAAVVSTTGCSKKADKELDKKAEELGEALGNKLIVDMTKKELDEAKKKHASKGDVDDACTSLLSSRSDVEKANTPDAAQLSKDIAGFCIVEVKVGGRVAALQTELDEMLAAQKKKDRSMEQLHWASFTTSCDAIKRDFESLKEDNLQGDSRVAPLKAQVEKICTPENVARKKYFT